MVYKVNNILRDVRVAIDENKTNDVLLVDGDIDTLMLDDIIRSKIEEAVRRVILDAPIHLLDGAVPFEDDDSDHIFWNEHHNGTGHIILPTDFLRLIVFKMSDWERPVYVAISPADPEYQLQFSRYKGLRGNPQKPVVAVSRRQEGLVLELFSCKNEDATIEQALYMKKPTINKSDLIDIPERCYQSVVYKAASLVLATLGNQLSVTMNDLCNQLLV